MSYMYKVRPNTWINLFHITSVMVSTVVQERKEPTYKVGIWTSSSFTCSIPFTLENEAYDFAEQILAILSELVTTQ
jgi:hypothetical protein